MAGEAEPARQGMFVLTISDDDGVEDIFLVRGNCIGPVCSLQDRDTLVEGPPDVANLQMQCL
jgi:hypothetical protein